MSAQTILLVEDDPDIRDGVRILLAGEGYHILEAENGARALEVFGPEVDLVILDVMMPGMSGLRVVVLAALETYAQQTDLRQKETVRLLEDFQSYVTEEQLAASDVEGITRWVDEHDFTLLELYQDHVLVYSSFVPERQDLNHEGQSAPFYDWTPRAPVSFTDGQLDAVLYCDVLRANAMLATRMLTLGCIALFLGVFLLGCRRIVRYICLLSEEIQAMEGGDLDHPVTVQGADELTTLASCLDSMRKTLNRQHQEKAEADARVKNLITEMSHDLRTPLTTLLLYTEILRYGKYQGEEQLHAYLDRVDEKAQQIKQLAENILEYSLAAQNRPVELQEPLPAQEVLGEALHEALTYLSQCGYTYELALDFGEAQIAVHIPYIRRLVDNISSNILKYADRRFPVQVQAGTEGPWFFLRFRNRKGGGELAGQGTGVGLSSLRSMMDRMGGSIQVEQTGTAFQITLEIPLSQEKKENA